jgi:hypothetical protein
MTYADLDPTNFDPEVQQWVEMLGSEDVNDRLVAVKSLQHIGEEEAIPSSFKLLRMTVQQCS